VSTSSQRSDRCCRCPCSGVVFDLFTLGAVTVSSLQFQTNSAAFLSAVREIAGQDTGLNVLDKASQAANTLKVTHRRTASSMYGRRFEALLRFIPHISSHFTVFTQVFNALNSISDLLKVSLICRMAP